MNVNTHKIVLVSFADKRYKYSLERLREQTIVYPFSDRFFFTEANSLSPSFWRGLKPWLYRRGFGYWAWKFALVKDVFDKLSYGDILFYSDAGITWDSSSQSIERFNQYISLLQEDDDILVFDYPLIEQEWTKGDVLEALGVYNNDSICSSKQIIGGFFCLKKTKRTISFVDRMLFWGDIKKELITDKRSAQPNKEGFQETRHDQSIFSVLVKTFPHVTLHYNLIQEVDESGNAIDCPIRIIRHKEKERSVSTILLNKLVKPWRMVLNIYFRYFRDYEFKNTGYPW